MAKIYKVVTKDQWDEAKRQGVFTGAPIDHQDGYIHFSTREQVQETVEKHFRDQKDLLLVAVDEQALGDDLKWEPSRGGSLFPHLYAELSLSLATDIQALIDRPDGGHDFPEQF